MDVAESSNLAKSSANSHSIQPSFSLSLQESYSLVGAGLKNLGNTCFINSILQCMTYTTSLVQGLRISDHLQNCQCGNEHFCLFCALHYHIDLSLSSSGRVVLPHNLVDNISYISSYFQRFQQEDAHEFLQCLLDKLRRPCLFVTGNKTRLACESDNLVSRIFGGTLISKVCCCNCWHTSEKIEPLMDLSLEIEKVESLSDALSSFTKLEKIDDPEMRYTCEKCRQVVSIEKQFLLNEAPSVAAIHLKRFKSDGISVEKIKKPVIFPLELDLRPYARSKCDTDVELGYQLYAVVEHLGEASTCGHYISFVRPAPNTWFRLDDAEVALVPERYVLSREAYILFYAKKETPWACSLMEGPMPSFKPNALTAALETPGLSVPRARVDAERRKKKAGVESSEKREALRCVQRSMHGARGRRFTSAMLEFRGEGPTGKAKKRAARARTSPRMKSGSANARRKVPQNKLAPRFVAAGNGQ